MKVTIVGAGNMGRGIGTRVVAGGHDVEIVDRDPADSGALAAELGGSASALDPGAPFGGEVVVFAVDLRTGQGEVLVPAQSGRAAIGVDVDGVSASSSPAADRHGRVYDARPGRRSRPTSSPRASRRS